jgi:hypothetical protein
VTFAANAIADASLAQASKPKQQGFFHAHIEGPAHEEERKGTVKKKKSLRGNFLKLVQKYI